jgi:hypothetical protein
LIRTIKPKVPKRIIPQTKRAGTLSLPVPLRATAEIDARPVRHREGHNPAYKYDNNAAPYTNTIAKLSNEIY